MPQSNAPLDHPRSQIVWRQLVWGMSANCIAPPTDGSTVHLWWTQVEDFDRLDLAALGHRLLPDEELAKCLRLTGAADRHRALLTRIMVRTLLSCYHNTPPEQWQFTVGAEGKPALANPGLHCEFNLAHSGSLILCGYSAHHPIGVDIEHVNRKRRVLAIAESYFAEGEHQYLSALPKDLATAEFYTLWTLKEAYVKTLGNTLPEHLTNLEFRRQPDGDYQLKSAGLPASPYDSVHHQLIPDVPDYPVAVAMQGAQHRPSCEHFRLRPDLVETLCRR